MSASRSSRKHLNLLASFSLSNALSSSESDGKNPVAILPTVAPQFPPKEMLQEFQTIGVRPSMGWMSSPDLAI